MSAGLTNGSDFQIYGGRDPRLLPTYPLDIAARFLLLPKSTLKAWIFGATWRPKGKPVRYYQRLLDPPNPPELTLSFVNLVEAHVLKSLRRTHLVRMENIRIAIDDLKQRFGTQHPLADVDLLVGNRSLILEERRLLLNIGMGKQLAMDFVRAYLSRIERRLDVDSEQATKLFPFVAAPRVIGKVLSESEHNEKIVAIDPYVSFGRPIINGTGIPTVEIAERFFGGDSISDLIEDFGRTQTEIEYAIRWENAQQAA
jgi:uncharacterized protein (DUF433 family)